MNTTTFDPQNQRQPPERGLLRLLILGLAFGGIIDLLSIAVLIGQRATSPDDLSFVELLNFSVSIVVMSTIVLSSWGIWQWKKWGVYGLFIAGGVLMFYLWYSSGKAVALLCFLPMLILYVLILKALFFFRWRYFT